MRKRKKSCKVRLPVMFKSILWSYDFSLLDPEKHRGVIILAAINYGDVGHWKWIKKYYGDVGVRRTIADIPASAFRGPALKLASLLFNIHDIKHAPRGTM